MSRFFLLIACCSPILLWCQNWQLAQHYPEADPEGVRSAFAPDSVLTIYRPSGDPKVEEVLKLQHLFIPNPEEIKLDRGDVVWLKMTCISVEDTAVRYLLEADRQYAYWEAVDIFEVSGDSVGQSVHTGNQLLAAEKPIRNARNLFRLEKAQELLTSSQLNISEIAYSCGFSDPGYFGKLFAKRYGISPQAYRNGVKN